MFRILVAALALLAASASASETEGYTRMPDGSYFAYTPDQIGLYVKADRDFCLSVLKLTVEQRQLTPQDAENCLSNASYGPPVQAGPVIFAPASDGYPVSDDRVRRLYARLFINDDPGAAFTAWVSGILAQYQWFHGLRPTGNLDAETVATLDRNVRRTSVPADWKAPRVPEEAPPAQSAVESDTAAPQSESTARAAPPPNSESAAPTPPPTPAAPATHQASAPATVDLHSLSLFLFAFAILFMVVRGRPAMEWAFTVGGPRVASAARSPRVKSFFGQAWEALRRMYASLKGSPAVPKAVGIAGGLIAYFFNEPRRLAAWGSIAASLYAFITGLAMGTVPSAFGGWVLLVAGVSCAQYHFSVIDGQPRALAYKQLLGNIAFRLIPAFFGTLLFFGFLALGLPEQQGAGVLSIFVGVAIAVCYFSAFGAFRNAAWRSYCEYEEMLAAGSGGFSSIDIMQRIQSQLPPTSLDIEPVIEALLEQLAGDIPEPPGSLFDVHAHYAYLQSLKALSFATPEAEDLFVQMVVAALLTIVPEFPKIASEPMFTAQRQSSLAEVSSFIQCFNHPRAIQLRVLERLRSAFSRNVAEVQARGNGLKEGEQVELALRDTPFLELFRGHLPYELDISDEFLYGGIHICAPPGGMKTQLTQTLSLHLAHFFNDPAQMVLDSQGPVLDLLEAKFAPQLGASFLRIHPHKSPVRINPFDIDFAGNDGV